jgi:hypothetical protein
MLASDPTRNVLFVPDDDRLVIVDCNADTIASQVELPEWAADLVAYDPLGDKVYVAHKEPG